MPLALFNIPTNSLSATSGEHFRRVLRAVFILSLVVLVGWLLSVSFVPINALFFTALQWVFRLFGSDPFKSEDLFYSIFMPLQSLVHWVNIMASAGGAPILFLTRFWQNRKNESHKWKFNRNSYSLQNHHNLAKLW